MRDDVHSLGGPHFVLTPGVSLHEEDTPENRGIVRQIYAYVDACDGITIEELEKGIIQDMRRALAQVVPMLEERNRGQQPATGAKPIIAWNVANKAVIKN